MHSKSVLVFIVAFFTVLATANPPPTHTVTVTATAPASTETTISQCNTGTVSCCNTVQTANQASNNVLLGLLGIVLGEVTGLVGFGCTPILPVIGGGVRCTQSPVCCTNAQFNGVINFGCNPITL